MSPIVRRVTELEERLDKRLSTNANNRPSYRPMRSFQASPSPLRIRRINCWSTSEGRFVHNSLRTIFGCCSTQGRESTRRNKHELRPQGYLGNFRTKESSSVDEVSSGLGELSLPKSIWIVSTCSRANFSASSNSKPPAKLKASLAVGK